MILTMNRMLFTQWEDEPPPSFLDSLFEPFRQMAAWLANNAASILARALFALLIILMGLGLSLLFRKLVEGVLKWVRVEEISKDMGLTRLLGRAGVQATPTRLVGRFAFFLGLIGTLSIVFRALDLSAGTQLLQAGTHYLPRLIGALLVLGVGLALSTFVGRMVHLAASAADIQEGHVLGRLVSALIIGIAVAMALFQLEIANHIVVGAFWIVTGSLGLAFALAFGLGCRDLARDLMENILGRGRKSR